MPSTLNLELKAAIGDIVVFQHAASRKLYKGEVLEINISVGVHTDKTASPAFIGKQFTKVTYKVNCGPRDEFANKDRIKLIGDYRVREVYPSNKQNG